MFGSLSTLLDRNSVLGFILPTLLFFVNAIWIIDRFQIKQPYLTFTSSDLLKDGTVLAVACVVASVILMLLNNVFYRFLEGYRGEGFYQKLYKWLGSSKRRDWLEPQSRRYRRHSERLASIDAKEEKSPGEEADGRQLAHELAFDFPGKDLLLPTQLGNTIRSAEDYPSRMYCFPGVEGWARLTAVIPKDFAANIDGEARGWIFG